MRLFSNETLVFGARLRSQTHSHAAVRVAVPYGQPMLWMRALTFALLALAVVALIRYQRATDLPGRIAVGIGAMMLGVLGLVMVAMLVLPN